MTSKDKDVIENPVVVVSKGVVMLAKKNAADDLIVKVCAKGNVLNVFFAGDEFWVSPNIAAEHALLKRVTLVHVPDEATVKAALSASAKEPSDPEEQPASPAPARAPEGGAAVAGVVAVEPAASRPSRGSRP